MIDTIESLSKKREDLDRVHLILEKYYACLKSQQNQNRVAFENLNTSYFLKTFLQFTIYSSLIACVHKFSSTYWIWSHIWNKQLARLRRRRQKAKKWSIYAGKSSNTACYQSKADSRYFFVFFKLNFLYKLPSFFLKKRSFSNIYMEFFKNLPTSFSAKSNYQVAVLFTTIQNEAHNNVDLIKLI